MTCTGGHFILFADADGATDANDVWKLFRKAEEVHAKHKNLMIIGSRAHLVETEAVVKVRLLQKLTCDSVLY
jgi:dolichyl-phosphate beta-glucosyltransferase